MEQLSPWSSITFTTLVFEKKKETEELLPEPQGLCETLSSL